MQNYTNWIIAVVKSLKSMENENGDPFINSSHNNHDIAKEINSYVDEESLKGFFKEGLDPTEASARVVSL